jgi:tetratricopeptide (TPR) repeat protein
LCKRAIELDPNFAGAYALLGVNYNNTGQPELCREMYAKAFALRDRASERERLRIASYYSGATGEIDNEIESLELLFRMYPRENFGHNNLALCYYKLGQFEKAIEEFREDIRRKRDVHPFANQLSAFIGLNRFEEAKELAQQALAQQFDVPSIHSVLYTIAFEQGDAVAMKAQVDWAAGRSEERAALTWQASASAFSGRLKSSHQMSHRAIELDLRRDLKGPAAQLLTQEMSQNALVGECRHVKDDGNRALALSRDLSVLQGVAAHRPYAALLSKLRPSAAKCPENIPNRL